MMFDLVRPCVNCPFRKGQGELFAMHPDRLNEILNAVAFPCHKTIDYGESRVTYKNDAPQQCAGLMAVLHRSDQPNQIMQVAERLRDAQGNPYLDPSKLDPRNEAYASIDEAWKAHGHGKRQRPRR